MARNRGIAAPTGSPLAPAGGGRNKPPPMNPGGQQMPSQANPRALQAMQAKALRGQQVPGGGGQMPPPQDLNNPRPPMPGAPPPQMLTPDQPPPDMTTGPFNPTAPNQTREMAAGAPLPAPGAMPGTLQSGGTGLTGAPAPSFSSSMPGPTGPWAPPPPPTNPGGQQMPPQMQGRGPQMGGGMPPQMGGRGPQMGRGRR